MNKALHGDCIQELKKMADQSADAVIMDPPYCSGGFSLTQIKAAPGQGLRSKNIKKNGWFINDNMTTAGLLYLLRNVMIECERILKPNRSALIFTDWRMVPMLAPALESTGMRYQNMIVWNKGQMGLGRGFRAQHEIILHYAKGTAEYYSADCGNVITTRRMAAKDKNHQTEKPVELIGKLIKVITKPGDTIIDPFFGSGAVGAAAIKLNRSVIGIEKNKTYVNIANEKIKEAIYNKQTELFTETTDPTQ